jgi:hypothetical protein
VVTEQQITVPLAAQGVPEGTVALAVQLQAMAETAVRVAWGVTVARLVSMEPVPRPCPLRSRGVMPQQVQVVPVVVAVTPVCHLALGFLETTALAAMAAVVAAAMAAMVGRALLRG